MQLSAGLSLAGWLWSLHYLRVLEKKSLWENVEKWIRRTGKSMDSEDLWWSAFVPRIYASWRTCRCVYSVAKVYFELKPAALKCRYFPFLHTTYPFEDLLANLMLWWGTIIVLESEYTMSWWFWVLLMQFSLWNLAGVYKSWARSPSFSLLFAYLPHSTFYYFDVILLFPAFPESLLICLFLI